MARILIVDDESTIRRVVERHLTNAGHSCEQAEDAQSAWTALRQERFDVLFSDINMPGQSGLDLVARVRRARPHIAVIMMTGVDDPAVAEISLDQGVDGYLVKPFSRNELLIALAGALRRRGQETSRRHEKAALERAVKERTSKLRDAVNGLKQAKQQLVYAQEETLRRLSRAAEFRDNETAEHIQRMSLYCVVIARRLDMSRQDCETLRLASLMHDVGKIVIPDAILLKPGKLDPDEFETMRRHSEIGHRILSGSHSPVLELAPTIALTHHEKVDGSGYPRNLAGADIPLEGRIAAVADVFDALTSERVYKSAIPVEEAIEIVIEGRGSHFDPPLVDHFLDAMDEVVEIRERYADRPAVSQSPVASYLSRSGVWQSVSLD